MLLDAFFGLITELPHTIIIVQYFLNNSMLLDALFGVITEQPHTIIIVGIHTHINVIEYLHTHFMNASTIIVCMNDIVMLWYELKLIN